MIDPHVHLRDWEQSYKETIEHGLETAYRAGLDAVFEMPNTSPPITSIDLIIQRIADKDCAMDKLKSKYPNFNMGYGLFAGVTANPVKIKEIVEAYNELDEVVGLKMFAGRSTGDLEIIEEDKQRLVYDTLADLDYRGVIAVHCEKEAFMKPKLWNPDEPYTHTLARPAESEDKSVQDQIMFAQEAGFKGTLHICHVSVPKSLERIEKMRDYVSFKMTCGITPHHAMMYDEMMKEVNGLFRKMNPPLRLKWMQEEMLQALIDGRIPWVESDHAYHTRKEKLGKALDSNGKPIYASGVPVFHYYPRFIKFLREKGMTEKQIDNITHNNIEKAFGIKIKNTRRAGKQTDEELEALSKEYEFDAFKKIMA
ncbi:amidohydrolase family protein [Candidatus Woesearchaeota archaeon]|nr:amidohydrolase family protein [Candidatus Woesearchaeota archaeon]